MPALSIKETFDLDGYVVVRQFLSDEEFAELKENLDRYIREVVPGLPDGDAFYDDRSRPETLKQMQHMEGDAYFREYLKHPRWSELAQKLLGEPSACQSTEWFNKPPGTNHPTPPHQDNYYFNLAPPQVLTMWLALDPVDEENGCLRYVPGSHLPGRRPHARSNVLGFSQGLTDYGDDDRRQEVAICMNPGDVTIHHGWTIHRADPNSSQTRHRRSFAMVFRGESAKVDTEGFQRYLAQMKEQHAEIGLKT